MAVSAFDHPWLGGLLGDEETAGLFGPAAEIEALLAFELALAEAEADAGVIPGEAAAAIAVALQTFVPGEGALRQALGRDGVVGPELIRQLRSSADPHGEWVHFAATSQDLVDTALVLRLRQLLPLFGARLSAVEARLHELQSDFGSRALMGHTRMQAAIPITAGDRIETWRAPLRRHRDRLETLLPEVLVVQFGGAAGTLDKLGAKGPEVRARLAAALGLGDAPQWHNQRDRLLQLGGWLAQVTGSLGKMGQDVALMAETGGELRLSGGGASSAMAHKQNPVVAEVLVALARYTAAQSGGLAQAAVHEQERSGAAWTLEWLLLPGMLQATGAALRLAQELLGSIEEIGRQSSSRID